MSKKVIASFVILLFAVSFISAVWWNPFSWGKDDVQLAPEVASGTFMEFVLSKGSHSYSIIVGEECFQLQFNGGALWVSGRSCDNWDVGLSGVGGSFNDLFPSRVISPQGMSTLIKIKKVEQDKLTVILSDYNAGSGVGYWFERGNTNYTHLLVDGDFYYKGTNGIWTKMETTRTSGGMNVLPSVGDKFEVPVTGFYDRINKNTILIYANGDVYTRNLNGNFVKDNSYLTQTGIPQGFKPILGYWHSIGSERINLWNKDGKLLVYNPNDNRWYDRTDSVVTGEPGKLPLGFKPVFGYWHPFTQSGGAINLWTSEGTIYYTTDGSTFNSMTLATANTNFRTLPGKDGKFEVPIVGFYDEIEEKVVLIYSDGKVYTRSSVNAPYVLDNNYFNLWSGVEGGVCGDCENRFDVAECATSVAMGESSEQEYNQCLTESGVEENQREMNLVLMLNNALTWFIHREEYNSNDFTRLTLYIQWFNQGDLQEFDSSTCGNVDVESCGTGSVTLGSELYFAQCIGNYVPLQGESTANEGDVFSCLRNLKEIKGASSDVYKNAAFQKACSDLIYYSNPNSHKLSPSLPRDLTSDEKSAILGECLSIVNAQDRIADNLLIPSNCGSVSINSCRGPENVVQCFSDYENGVEDLVLPVYYCVHQYSLRETAINGLDSEGVNFALGFKGSLIQMMGGHKDFDQVKDEFVTFFKDYYEEEPETLVCGEVNVTDCSDPQDYLSCLNYINTLVTEGGQEVLTSERMREYLTCSFYYHSNNPIEGRGVYCENIGSGRVPVGYQVFSGGKTQYCNFNGEYSDVKDDKASCTNDFECKSNVCLGGECVAFKEAFEAQASLIQRIYCWITNPLTPESRATCLAEFTGSGGD
jgi:hypothetical protein